MEQEDPEEFWALQEQLRAGEYNVQCEFCKGQRVVSPEKYEDHADWAAYQAEVAAEQRYFGYAA
jgi:cytochrome c5